MDPFKFDANDLVRAIAADGEVAGRPIDITQDESFTVDVALPPLRRPEIEIVLETLEVKDGALLVTKAYRASLAQDTVKVGSVEVVLKNLQATSLDKKAAPGKLARLAGKAIAQVYMKLLSSNNPEEVAAAKSMEVRP